MNVKSELEKEIKEALATKRDPVSARTFWSFFALYDGAVRCQECQHEQTAQSLTHHEDWCQIRDEANAWYYAEQVKQKEAAAKEATVKKT